MSQSTINKYFISRKRPASDDIVSSKRKIAHLDGTSHTVNNDLKTKLVEAVKCKVEESAVVPNQIKLHDDQKLHQATKTLETSVDTPVFAKKVNACNVTKEPSKSETINIARKELSLGDIRKRLGRSSRLAELKATAERLSTGIKRLQETSDTRSLKEFKSIDVEVPISPSKKSLIQNAQDSPERKVCSIQQRPLMSPRKVVVSPIKSPSKVPAYIKHASLATTSSLPLPHHYRFLAELFRGMETVVSLLYNRNEKITFAKLRPSVQEMLKRSFSEKHLAQIKNLVPDYYNFEIQKVKNFSNTSQKETYELVISPNVPNNIKILNPSILLERRRYFYDILLQLVKKHHAQYLKTLDPPLEISDSKLVRWHPEFELEKIPDVECANLPEVKNEEKFSTAQDVLAKARELFKCNTKMERAMEKLATARARGLTEEEKIVTGIYNEKTNDTSTQTDRPSTSTVPIMNPALRNLPAALLEKVKAKQAAKALDSMTRSSEGHQKYQIYTRLPDLARTLRNIFVTERKNVLALNIILSKLDSSFKSNVSASDLQRDIKVLVEEVPDWIKFHDLRNTTYLKLDRNADLNQIVSKLDILAKKYKY